MTINEGNGRVTVQIKYAGVEETFQGTPEEVWFMLSKFFGQHIATFEIAQKLSLSVDIQALAKDCEGLIVFSPEGPNVLPPKGKMTDNETLALWLLASYLGSKLHLLDDDAFSKEELQVKLGKSSKITSTRLGELVKNDFIAKTDDDKFRISTFGIAQMQKEWLPRIKSKNLS